MVRTDNREPNEAARIVIVTITHLSSTAVSFQADLSTFNSFDTKYIKDWCWQQHF